MYPKIHFENLGAVKTSYRWDNVPTESNVSNKDAALIAQTTLGYDGFILSPSHTEVVSAVGGTSKLWAAPRSYPGYISQGINSETFVNVTLSIEISGNSPVMLTIGFDEDINQYAKDFSVYSDYNSNQINIVDNTDVTRIIPLAELQLPQDNVDHIILSIHITRWSNPHSAVRITRLNLNSEDGFENLILTGSDIIDFECSENLYDSDLNITPGICEQYADIKFYDRHHIFEQGSPNAEYRVTITTEDPESILGVYKTCGWDIPGDSSVVTVHCNDKLFALDKINAKQLSIKTRTLTELLTMFFEQGGALSWRFANDLVRSYCNNIFIPRNWSFESNLREVLDKLCWVGMLRIYWKNNAYVVDKAWTVI